jgi:hypothetical protein
MGRFDGRKDKNSKVVKVEIKKISGSADLEEIYFS